MNAAIRLYYVLCASPTELVTNLLGSLFKMGSRLLKQSRDKGGDKALFGRGKVMLSVALHAAGHAALHLAIWVECTLVPLLIKPKDKKKDKKDDDDDLEGMFGDADDAAYEEENILRVLDTELCRGPFASIVSLAQSVLKNAAKWPEMIQCAATVAIAKFMIASKTHAEEKSALLFTILAKSESVAVRQAVLAAYPDILVRWPNVMEPWTKVVFEKLHDEEKEVRQNTLNLVADLVVKGLVKPRGKMHEIATLLLDEEECIKEDTKAGFEILG